MRRRRLNDEDLEVWREVARTASPLARRDRFASVAAPQPVAPAPARFPVAAPRPAVDLAPFRLGERAGPAGPSHDVLPGLTDRMSALPVRMDKKAFGKLRRGKMVPEARIDLHGMTTERAHAALTAFVLRSQAQDKRLVLVITGKGKRADDDGPIPVRQGVLRHNVPHWLDLPPLSDAVIQVSAAHARHGGGGAYYVYLRRRR
jgi:DNA-nicking Smr family endonuclease